MELKTEKRLGVLLEKSKWITMLGVLVLYLSSGILVIIGILKLYYIVSEIVNQIKNNLQIDTIQLSASLLLIIEIYLLAIIFYIFALGIYKIFIGKSFLGAWNQIDTLDEMKAELAKAIVIFLSIFIVQKIIEWKDPAHLLSTGIVIAFSCANLIWYTNSMRKKKNNNNNIEEINKNKE